MLRANIIILATIAGLATPAFAADLSEPSGPYRGEFDSYKDGPSPATTFIWTGFYVGVNAGYGKGGKGDRADLEISAFDVPLGSSGETEPKGAFGGLQVGYNKQMGRFVFGLEADLQGGGLDDRINGVHGAIPGFPFTSRVSTETEFFGTIRARLGYTWDRALLYVTGGYAFADTDYSLSASNPDFGDINLSDSDLREGYVVGAGAEFMLDGKWTMKFEYQYLKFSDNMIFAQSTFNGAPTGTFYETDLELDLHTVRVGVNRKF